MQTAFDFGTPAEISYMRDQLRAALGPIDVIRKRDACGQMIKSLISSRTRDEVSLAAYERLVDAYPCLSDLAAAAVEEIETLIADVTHARDKAVHLKGTLRIIAACHPDFDLGFLGRWPVDDALAWLERLPGVGPKVSASTLNFSTLRMPAFVVDTHVLRILQHFGIISEKTGIEAARDTVMAAAERWDATDLAEFHVLLKRLGQTVCQAGQPLCRTCPLRTRCRAAGAGGFVSRAAAGAGKRLHRPSAQNLRS
ncbi:endonuclease III domain-containing protein [Rhizobium binxianense]